MNIENILKLKALISNAIAYKGYTYAEIIRALSELISEYVIRSVEEDKK